MFHHPYSDCEDRAILYSWLVRNLLGFEATLLKYPNHVATAVNIEGEAKGAHISIGDAPSAGCDPSYVGAQIGEYMPAYRGYTPTAIMYK